MSGNNSIGQRSEWTRYNPGIIRYDPGIIRYDPGIICYDPGISRYDPGIIPGIKLRPEQDCKTASCVLSKTVKLRPAS